MHNFTTQFSELGLSDGLRVVRIDVTCPTQDYHVTIVRRAWRTFAHHVQNLSYLDYVRFVFEDRFAALRFRLENAREFRSLGEAGKVVFGWKEVISGRNVYQFYRYEQSPK